MTTKPAWAGEYGASYQDIVTSWGYEVLEFETFGSYQGDHLALVRDGESIGLVVFGYGCCSDCDELQSITPWGDDEDDDWSLVIEFAANLRQSIHWASKLDDLRDWIASAPENHWWAYDDDISRWLNANLGTALKIEDADDHEL